MGGEGGSRDVAGERKASVVGEPPNPSSGDFVHWPGSLIVSELLARTYAGGRTIARIPGDADGMLACHHVLRTAFRHALRRMVG